MVITTNNSDIQNTTHRVVLPFYVYAAIAFLAATVLLFLSGNAFSGHHFHPRILAITHTMALGWGTMIILGASYQLVPVLIEARLYSNKLAYASFILAAAGIPLLVYSFFVFQFGLAAQTGAVLINAALACYLLDVALSISKSKKRNVHATFVFTAACWLLITTLTGLLLVFNFTMDFLPKDSLHYLSLHAHIGIAGWFLLLVIGVGSRLIPMFLISKYDNPRALWTIYYLMNAAILLFIVLFFAGAAPVLFVVPIAMVLLALIRFVLYCRKAWQQRIRKQVDEQVRISLLSVVMMVLPVVLLLVIICLLLFSFNNPAMVLAYGFSIFFGWLTAIILGMTFKTLPFIVWNKVYHSKAGLGKTPTPKDLFHEGVFNKMALCYLSGFCLFVACILLGCTIGLQVASGLLFITAVLYNFNIMKMLRHKAEIQ